MTLLQSQLAMFEEGVRLWDADGLDWARGVLADVAHHDDNAIRGAARIIIVHSPDTEEVLEAEQFWFLAGGSDRLFQVDE